VRFLLSILCASALLSSSASAQNAVAGEGEDLAKSIRDGSTGTVLQSGAETGVPGYGGTTFDASKYLEHEEGLADAGVSARYSDPNYNVVIDPARPEFDPSTIALSGAKTVEDNPETYLGTDVAMGGAQAGCEPLPGTGAKDSVYFESCNQGDEIYWVPQTCRASLSVTVDKVATYVYYAATAGPYVNSGGFAGPRADGTCHAIGTFGYCSELRRYGWSPTGNCKDTDYSPEIIECTREISGLSGNPVWTGIDPATGQFWSSRSETAAPPVITRSEEYCAARANPDCKVEGGEVCTDSDPVTRVINGVAVTQPCWAWAQTYQCPHRRAANDCSSLEAKSNCQFDHNECLSQNEDGSCNVYDRVFRCTTPDAATASPPAFICGSDLYCINGECTQVEREASTEFKDAMVAVHAMGDVRDQFDPASMTLFNGEKAGCHKPVFGLVNCCAGKTSGLLTTAAGGAALAGGPAAIAALATPFLTMFLCSGEEMMLDVKDRMGLCHYVGTYCSDKVIGVCISKTRNYCCFESKLSRIIQEQGRSQLGKSWGTPKTPDCKGFSPEEFQRLDLSRMDFTEVYNEFIDAAKVPDEIQTSIEIQEKIEEYYRLHGGAPK
jgi:conjugal transfer mating pair stabilization protein TraN